MDKRTIFAMLLIMLVFFVSQEFLWKKPVPKKPAATADSVQTTNQSSSAQPAQSGQTPSLGAAPTVDSTGVSQRFLDAAFIAKANSATPANDDISLENAQMRVVFSNRGGTIQSVELKDFRKSDKKTVVDIIPAGKALGDLQVNFQSGRKNLSDIHFEHEIGADGQSVTFFIQKDSVRLLERRYELLPNYNMKTVFRGETSTVAGGGVSDYRIMWDSGVADSETPVDDRNGSYVVKAQVDNKLQSEKYAQLKSRKTLTGNLNWVVVRSKYFGLGLIPERRLNIANLQVFREGNSTAATMDVTNRTALTSFEDNYDLYFGPCTYLQVTKYQPLLRDSAEMGWHWLAFLSKFFLMLFSILHKLLPNYGLVILVFSLILKVLLQPLNSKAMASSKKMQKMQEYQPQIKEIQKKYKNDPRQMQAELARLYKENNIPSPMSSCVGGCLPYLLQMPVFFALYPALRYSLEMRQAGFVSWLKDLSVPDPYYILPILMGVAMMVQSKLMPQPKPNTANMDDQQRAAMQSQKLMTYIMPVFMFFIFKSLPAGLVLYWMSFNIYSIIQLYYSTRKQQTA